VPANVPIRGYLHLISIGIIAVILLLCKCLPRSIHRDVDRTILLILNFLIYSLIHSWFSIGLFLFFPFRRYERAFVAAVIEIELLYSAATKIYELLVKQDELSEAVQVNDPSVLGCLLNEENGSTSHEGIGCTPPPPSPQEEGESIAGVKVLDQVAEALATQIYEDDEDVFIIKPFLLNSNLLQF